MNTIHERHAENQKPAERAHSEAVPQRQFDPVCGMDVDPEATTVERIDRKGVSYYFCSADCRRQFEASPEEYAS
jgi:YHS domain-containing protein